MPDLTDHLWKFIRGDTPASEFEQWVYDTPALEELFGPEMYLEVISLDYRNPSETAKLQDRLRSWLDEHVPRDCECITWQDDEDILMGSETVNFWEDFVTLRRRTPWLDLLRCPHCGSHWYLATDTVDDDYHLRRLTDDQVARILQHDEWPDWFDNLRTVWPDQAWLLHYGHRDLADWQKRHGRPEE